MYMEEITRFKTAVNKVVNEVDKAYIRKLQADSHECAAACCRDNESSTETLLRCVENCSQELQVAQKIVLSEFDRLEDRFERCMSSCNDLARTEDLNGLEDRKIIDGCVRRCVDVNIEIIPDLVKAIEHTLNKRS